MKILADEVHRLDALIKGLTYQQIREIRSTIEEVDFHCDIISKLPLEISQLILQYFSLHQIFWARRVSPKWRHILSSTHTEELLLQDWFPKCYGDQGLKIPTGLSTKSVASLKAEHIDAYRTGHAFGYARYEWDCAYDLRNKIVAYADGVMAWVDTTNSHFVELLDFQTGEKWSFMPVARTRVYDIAMSSSMVAILGVARCDVWNFRTGDRYSLQFPSAQAKIAVSGESLAILHIAESSQAGHRAEVVTWRLKDQKTYSFSMTLPSRKGRLGLGFKMMLDSKGESLLLFQRVYMERGEVRYFVYIRTSLNGDLQTQGFIEAPHIVNHVEYSGDSIPKEANGHAVIWSYVKCESGEDDGSELMLIVYNFQKDRLESRTQIVRGLYMNLPSAHGRVYNLFVWKDVAYYLENRSNRLGLRVIDLRESSCTEARMDFSVDTQGFHQRIHDRNKPQRLAFGDETFLINVFEEGFCVWCFNPNVRMFNEEITYKEERKSNRETRLLLKQNRKDGSSDDPFTRKLD